MSTNSISIKKKLLDLRAFLFSINFSDVVAITKMWLYAPVSDSEVTTEDYKNFSLDSILEGGEVTFLKDLLTVTTIYLQPISNIDLLTIASSDPGLLHLSPTGFPFKLQFCLTATDL